MATGACFRMSFFATCLPLYSPFTLSTNASNLVNTAITGTKLITIAIDFLKNASSNSSLGTLGVSIGMQNLQKHHINYQLSRL
ncbi:hypothetical protein BGY98DRAFT_984530 [Russula aff. rugulosa BPL654]|nr:hypothetical protein BGY98DRAFT_984530 [Russula aff. rugulosa BPL654]